jgi:hypothetical protein
MFGCDAPPAPAPLPNPYYLLADNYEELDAGIFDYSYEDIIINDHHSGIYCEMEGM